MVNSGSSDPYSISDSGVLSPGKDPLTGLYGRDFLETELEKYLKADSNRPAEATLALLQLENFYEIRQWVGKSEANLLLADIAKLLAKSLPSKTILCRCAHFEFAVLLFNEASLTAKLITDRVKHALQSAASELIPPQLELKCGVGLARTNKPLPCSEVLFARARHSLSHSLYRKLPGTKLSAKSQPATLRSLRETLEDNKIELVFQATVNLKEDGMQHYEVRCRFPLCDPNTPPLNVFELAIHNALGEAIDRWVIDRSLSTIREQKQKSLRLTVNLTQNSMVSPKFFKWLEDRLARDHQAGKQLIFQISEIDVLIAQHHMQHFCNKLNSLDIKLVINHFGCTADPFRYLSLLQAHFVKLDVSLLEKLNVSSFQCDRLGKTVIKLHQSGFRVIAGMVDDMNLLPLLWKSKINFVQGFCLHKPAAVMDFEFLKDEYLSLH